jgi:hypothetical protein
MILRDIMENTIIKETIIKEKSTLLYYFYCYCEKCYLKKKWHGVIVDSGGTTGEAQQ